MTVTLRCHVCRRPHITTIAALGLQRPCPFCGGGVSVTKPEGACEHCGEHLANPELGPCCGFCAEEQEQAA